jgi:predicted nucleic acid-binding protein
MKLLIDTNVLLEFYRNQQDKLARGCPIGC